MIFIVIFCCLGYKYLIKLIVFSFFFQYLVGSMDIHGLSKMNTIVLVFIYEVWLIVNVFLLWYVKKAENKAFLGINLYIYLFAFCRSYFLFISTWKLLVVFCTLHPLNFSSICCTFFILFIYIWGNIFVIYCFCRVWTLWITNWRMSRGVGIDWILITAASSNLLCSYFQFRLFICNSLISWCWHHLTSY